MKNVGIGIWLFSLPTLCPCPEASDYFVYQPHKFNKYARNNCQNVDFPNVEIRICALQFYAS